MPVSRRDFITTALAGSVAVGLSAEADAAQESPESEKTEKHAAKLPIIICASNGYNYLDQAYAFLSGGGDTLDAALKVVQGPENDPNDESVGLGGHPNEEGVVELDACCMHGPTRTAGSVGGVRNIKNVSLLSNTVRLHTGHVMLVGEGAERFAVAQGFQRENLLTDKSRKEWLLWKETHSDWWGPGITSAEGRKRFTDPAHAHNDEDEWGLRIRRMQQIASEIGIPPELQMEAIRYVIFPPTGTIHCSALNHKAEISGCTTTSGLAWKIPGRVGDSPIIGAGNFVDNEVGAAGSTGRGEENIRVCGAHTVVEMMRKGMSPSDACMEALQRIAYNFKNDKTRLTEFTVQFYALNKDGAHGGGTLWGTATGGTPNYAIHDGASAKHVPFKALFDGASRPTPKTPQ